MTDEAGANHENTAHYQPIEDRLRYAQLNAAKFRGAYSDVSEAAHHLQHEEERLRAYLCVLLNTCERAMAGNPNAVLAWKAAEMQKELVAVLRGEEP